MKLKIFSILCFFLLVSCKKEVDLIPKQWVKISERIQYLDGNQYFEFKSGKFSYKIEKSKLPFKNCMLLNSSLTGYFLELGEESKIIGISSPEYVYSDKIHSLMKENRIQNIGNEQKYDLERIIAAKPNAVFTNYVQSFENTYDVLRKNGIEVIFINEYEEQQPLAKSKIIEIFGKLLGAEEKAKNKYSEIENNYNELKKIATQSKEKPLVLANEMYGNQWFLPGGKTFAANFLQDANANYILKDNTEEKAIPLSFEEVFMKSENADFWVNLSNYDNRNQLLAINPTYAKLPVFQKGKLYSLFGRMHGTAVDAFESGTVRADLMLKDYIKIFHPELLSNEPFTYMKEIK